MRKIVDVRTYVRQEKWFDVRINRKYKSKSLSFNLLVRIFLSNSGSVGQLCIEHAFPWRAVFEDRHWLRRQHHEPQNTSAQKLRYSQSVHLARTVVGSGNSSFEIIRCICVSAERASPSSWSVIANRKVTSSAIMKINPAGTGFPICS